MGVAIRKFSSAAGVVGAWLRKPKMEDFCMILSHCMGKNLVDKCGIYPQFVDKQTYPENYQQYQQGYPQVWMFLWKA